MTALDFVKVANTGSAFGLDIPGGTLNLGQNRRWDKRLGKEGQQIVMKPEQRLFTDWRRVGRGGLAALALSFAGSSQAAESPETWPMFRGPNAGGQSLSGNRPPVEFGPGRNERWNTALPTGHSSPCVWGDMIFLTGSDPEAKKLEVLALRRANGKIEWRQALQVSEPEKVHPVSNLATATPATDGRRVVSYFGSFGLICHDLAGRELWRHPLPVYECMNGSGTSPLLVDDTVYLNREDMVDQALIALDAATGVEKWKRKHANAEPSMSGVASTPIRWKDEIVIHRSGSISAYKVATGEISWFVPAKTTGCSTPTIADGKLIVAAWNNAGEADQAPPWPEFGGLLKKHDKDGDQKLSEPELPEDLLLLVRPEIDAALGGDISLKMAFGFFDENKDGGLDAQEWKAALDKTPEYLKSQKHGVMAIDLEKVTKPGERLLWQLDRNVPEVPSPLVDDGRVYLVRNGGLAMCVDLRTGKILYQERLGAPGAYFASPIQAGGYIYFAAGSGKMAVVRRSEKFEVVAINDLREDIYATPAAAGPDLLVRTAKRLYCFRMANRN